MAGLNIAAALARVDEQRPLVQAIVNQVVIAGVADAIRAIGGLPVMASDPLEAADMAAQASAVLLNTGTPDPRRFEGCLAAGRAANAHGVPVVLDPVGMGSTPWRTEQIRRLLVDVKFTAIRGNRSEIECLTLTPDSSRSEREPRSPVRGVEAMGTVDVDWLVTTARRARERTGATVCISGEVDVIAGEQVTLVRNGHALMGQVTGTGCMLSAVIAAVLGAGGRAEEAVVAYALAGELAAGNAQGPGSFRVALIDCLAVIQRERTARGVRMEVLP